VFSEKAEHRLRVPQQVAEENILTSEEAAGGSRKLHNELHNLHSSPNIMMIKSSRIRWMGHVTCVGEMNSVQNFGQKT
jgi:hypothetical protein